MGAWENSAYAWVVICKNNKFHRETNVLFGHKIPLGETDPYETPPALSGSFTAKCDECGKEYSYEPGEVMRLNWNSMLPSNPTHCFSKRGPVTVVSDQKVKGTRLVGARGRGLLRT